MDTTESELGNTRLTELLALLQSPEIEGPAIGESDLVCYAAGILDPEEVPPIEQALAASAGICRRLERIQASMATLDTPEGQRQLEAAKQRALDRLRGLVTIIPPVPTLQMIIGILFRQDIDFERVRNGLTRAFGAGAVSPTFVPAAAFSTRGSNETAQRPALAVEVSDEDLETLAETLHDGLRPGVSYSIARQGERPHLTISEGESKVEILKKLTRERKHR